jgi:hypothetical protein
MAKLKFTVKKRQSGSKNRGNGNAVKHGSYANITAQCVDGRSRLAKTLQATVNRLTSEVGGDPSGQESLLIQRCAFKALKCYLSEIEMMSEKNESLESRYLAWANSLRLDLQALGLERRVKNIRDLQTYISEKSE